MSVESAYNRRRKRIVEHRITGFESAQQAIIFGNTVESLVQERLGKVKFRQGIGSPDNPSIAITEGWVGPTALKTTFLEFTGDEAAQFICAQMQRALKEHNEAHSASARIANELIRDKPQPQTIGLG